jgi:hypothetical protein
MSWQIILFIIKITSPVEFCLAVILLLAILGSNSANATIDEIKINSDANISVAAA